MIVKRDQDIINFLDEFHAANTSQIHRLFFKESSMRYCCQRLEYLNKTELVKRARSTISSGYAYYIDKGQKRIFQQVHHDLIRTELYINIKLKYEVLEWNNEYTIAGIRPDALAYVRNNGIVFPVMIEVHLSNKFDFDKYKEFAKNDLKAMFGSPLPRVIICTDRSVTVQNVGVLFKIIDLNMKGLDSILK
jgi:hypothetical protein